MEERDEWMRYFTIEADHVACVFGGCRWRAPIGAAADLKDIKTTARNHWVNAKHGYGAGAR